MVEDLCPPASTPIYATAGGGVLLGAKSQTVFGYIVSGNKNHELLKNFHP